MTRKWAQPEIDINTQRVLNAEEQTKVSQLETLAKNMDIKIQWDMIHPDPEERKNIPANASAFYEYEINTIFVNKPETYTRFDEFLSDFAHELAHGAYDKYSGDHDKGPIAQSIEYYQEEWRAQTTAIAILDKNNIELDEFTRENSKAYLEDTVNSLQRRNSDIDESKANQDVVDRLLYIENAGLRTKNSLEVQNVITGGHATDITEQYKTENLQRELEKSVPEANMQDRPFVPLGIPHFDIITYAAMYGDIAEQQRASGEVMASEFGQQNEARIALERAEIAQRELLEQQMAQQLQAQLQTELLEKMRLEKEALARTPSFNIPFTM